MTDWKAAALAVMDELGRRDGIEPPGPMPEDVTMVGAWLDAKADRMRRLLALVECGEQVGGPPVEPPQPVVVALADGRRVGLDSEGRVVSVVMPVRG